MPPRPSWLRRSNWWIEVLAETIADDPCPWLWKPVRWGDVPMMDHCFWCAGGTLEELLRPVYTRERTLAERGIL